MGLTVAGPAVGLGRLLFAGPSKTAGDEKSQPKGVIPVELRSFHVGDAKDGALTVTLKGEVDQGESPEGGPVTTELKNPVLYVSVAKKRYQTGSLTRDGERLFVDGTEIGAIAADGAVTFHPNVKVVARLQQYETHVGGFFDGRSVTRTRPMMHITVE